MFEESTEIVHCLTCKCLSTADCWWEGCLCLDCYPEGCGTEISGWKTRVMNWLRWGIGAFGITAVILTALELAFPYARWLNCGPSIPIIDKIIGPPGCAWDGRFLPFPLWQAVVFDFAGGMVSIVAAIIWDSV